MSTRSASLPKQPQRRCRDLASKSPISNLRISPLLRSYGQHAKVHQSDSSDSNSDDADNDNDPYFMNKGGDEGKIREVLKSKTQQRRLTQYRGRSRCSSSWKKTLWWSKTRTPTGLRTLTAGGSSIRSPSRNVKKEDGDDDEDYKSESVRKRESGRTITTSIPSGTSLQESGRTPFFRDFNPLVVLISNRYKRPRENERARTEQERAVKKFWEPGLPSPRCVAVIEEELVLALQASVFPEILFTKSWEDTAQR